MGRLFVLDYARLYPRTLAGDRGLLVVGPLPAIETYWGIETLPSYPRSWFLTSLALGRSFAAWCPFVNLWANYLKDPAFFDFPSSRGQYG